jgi:pimeloyl-ACP methyl ester carboxylesterase
MGATGTVPTMPGLHRRQRCWLIIAWSAKSIFWPGILQPRPNRRLVEIEGASHFLIQSYAEACAAIIEEDLSGGI